VGTVIGGPLLTTANVEVVDKRAVETDVNVALDSTTVVDGTAVGCTVLNALGSCTTGDADTFR
jgi:hypothetical protein